jgi:hypothetical protein
MVKRLTTETGEISTTCLREAGASLRRRQAEAQRHRDTETQRHRDFEETIRFLPGIFTKNI